MFDIRDTVMYGSAGVCTVEDIVPKKFNGTEVMYYVLKPASESNSTIYCPVDKGNEKMRRLLTECEVYDLIKAMPDTGTQWIDNDQLRRERFGEILKSGDHREIIKLIKTIHFTKEERQKAGKKLHASDERIMKDAESVIYGEFAQVLSIKPDEVVPFITGKLSGAQA